MIAFPEFGWLADPVSCNLLPINGPSLGLTNPLSLTLVELPLLRSSRPVDFLFGLFILEVLQSSCIPWSVLLFDAHTLLQIVAITTSSFTSSFTPGRACDTIVDFIAADLMSDFHCHPCGLSLTDLRTLPSA